MRIQAATENPFSSARVRPGALAFRAHAGESVAALVTRVRDHGWRGQIVGEHGSGKSTLVAALLAELRNRGIGVEAIRLGLCQRRPSPFWSTLFPGTKTGLLVVDGYEQLGHAARMVTLACTRLRRTGLIVTTHRAVRGLPVVAELAPSLQSVRSLFEELCAGLATPVTDADLVRSYNRHDGNVREIWFDLYDLHERRTRSGANGWCQIHVPVRAPWTVEGAD